MLMIRSFKILTKFYFLAVMVLCLSACGGNSGPSESEMSNVVFKPNEDRSNRFLAYEHQIQLELEEDELSPAYKRILNYCKEDTQYSCTMLSSSISRTGYVSASIQVRILPSGIEDLLVLVVAQGEIKQQSTSVVDLQTVIVDNEKRLDMLAQYETKLHSLQEVATKDVEASIKLAEELSKVQADLEYALGEKSALTQRTQMDMLSIELQVGYDHVSKTPIADAFSNFGDNLAEGVANTIEGLPFLIPWLIIVLLAFLLFRLIWRKTKTKQQ